MKEKKDSMIFPFRWRDSLSCLDDGTFRQIVTAILDYGETGETPDFSGALSALWKEYQNRIDHDRESYLAVCEKRRKSGRIGASKRWQNMAKDSKCYQAVAKIADGEGDGEGDGECSNEHTQIVCAREIEPDRKFYNEAAEKILDAYPRKGKVNASKVLIIRELYKLVSEDGKTKADAEKVLMDAATTYAGIADKFPQSRKGFVYTAETFFGGGRWKADPAEWGLLGIDPENSKKREAEYGYTFRG